jgi:hypothetical protein
MRMQQDGSQAQATMARPQGGVTAMAGYVVPNDAE